MAKCRKVSCGGGDKCRSEQRRTCELWGDPHVKIDGRGEGDGMCQGPQWNMRFKDCNNYEFQLQTMNCKLPAKHRYNQQTINCGFAVRLPDGSIISARSRKDIRLNCRKISGSQLAKEKKEYVKYKKEWSAERFWICAGGAQLEADVRDFPNASRFKLRYPKCRVDDFKGDKAQKPGGWCAAKFNKKDNSRMWKPMYGYRKYNCNYKPTRVNPDENLFNGNVKLYSGKHAQSCKVIVTRQPPPPKEPVATIPRERVPEGKKPDPVRPVQTVDRPDATEPAVPVQPCPKHVAQECAATFKICAPPKGNEAVCNFKPYVADCIKDACIPNLGAGRQTINFAMDAFIRFRRDTRDKGIECGCNRLWDKPKQPTEGKKKKPTEAQKTLPPPGVPVDQDGAEVGDFVWHDKNQNGKQDAGEPGIPNVPVHLVRENGDVQITKTDKDGKYRFVNLPPATYFVKFEKPAGFEFTTPKDGNNDKKDSDAQYTGNTTPFTLAAKEKKYTVDAGLVKPPPAQGKIGDFVWLDSNSNGVQEAGEPGIQGVRVLLFDANGKRVGTTKTNNAGFYEFSVPVGTYTVVVPLLGKAKSLTPTVTGKGTVATDSDGHHEANKNRVASKPVAVAANQFVNTVDFGFIPTTPGGNPGGDGGQDPAPTVGSLIPGHGAIGDHVWHDLNKNGIQDAGEPGIKGVKVHLLDGNGKTVLTETTSDKGYYLFKNLGPGSWMVAFEQPKGYSFTTPNVGQGVNGKDSAKDSDAGQDGWTSFVTLTAGQVNLDVDAGLITDPTGPFFEPPTGTLPAPLKVGDLIWYDDNADGIQNENPLRGVPGCQVFLYSIDGKEIGTAQTTDADGKYTHTVTQPGAYKIRFTLPANFKVSPFHVKNAAGAAQAEVDSDVVDKTTFFTVAFIVKDQDRLDQDVGIWNKKPTTNPGSPCALPFTTTQCNFHKRQMALHAESMSK